MINQDNFDIARENIWGQGGFVHKRSTIQLKPTLLMPQTAWIVESVRTEDDSAIFIQSFSANGGQRLVIPRIVAECIYRHHDAIMKVRRSDRAKKATVTRRAKAGLLTPPDLTEDPRPKGI